MANVRQTEYCCAIYEMGELDLPRDYERVYADFGYKAEKVDPKKWWDEQIGGILDECCSMGSRRELPRLIIFGDIAGKDQPGYEWSEQLRARGYTVETFDLGVNPKSGNRVTLYHWYTSKRRKSRAKTAESPKAAKKAAQS